MTTTVKITELSDIGANLASSTVVPVVNMAGTPTTQKTNIGNIANIILEGAGVDYPEATVALLAQTVSNAAQPNITSIGTLTTLAVSGNATVNGNITANGTGYLGNISTTGLASITTLEVGASANLGDVANITIGGGVDGYVLQTDGEGTLSWTAQTGGGGNGVPGGSNTQVQFNDAGSFGGNTGFTFNKTTGIFTSPFVAGNGNGLSNIQGANVSGAVGLATFAGTANAVAAANVSGLGNIATINLTGSNSNVLYGNGVFAPVTTSYDNSNVATFLAAFGSNTITTTGNISAGSLTVQQDVSGNGALRLQGIANGNSTINIGGEADIDIVANVGNINLYTANNQPWIFDQNGNLTLPDNSILSAEANNKIELAVAANSSFEVSTSDGGNYSWLFNPDGSLLVPEQSPTRASIFSRDSNSNTTSFIAFATSNVANLVLGTTGNNHVVINTDKANANVRWIFDDIGGITFPDGTVAQGDIEGTGNFGFEMPANVGFGILANLGNSEWSFGANGTLTLAGGINAKPSGFPFSDTITNITTGNPTVVVTVSTSVFPDPVTGQVTIWGVTGTSEANDTWYYQAVNEDQFQLFSDAACTIPVDGTSWTAYISGGNAYASQFSSLAISTNYLQVVAGGESWTFDNTGQINLPTESNSFNKGRIQSYNGYPTLLGYGSGEHGGPELDWMDSDDPATAFMNANVLRNTMYINDNGLYVGMNENNVANVAVANWRFTPDGTTIFPTLDVDLHNGGVQSAQTLQFGDNTQQVIITGPTPLVDNNAQRLIIQGQRGNGTGEGGDVYFWAGDADTNGGDIKIYAGDADNVSAGYGGYINITGGQGFDGGGDVAITAGRSTNSAGASAILIGGLGATTGGTANVQGGQGSVAGGIAELKGGYGGGSGGNVNITGGGAGNGLAEYGNINISAGASSWVFGNDGNLTLPSGGSVFSVNNTPSGNPGNTIILQPAGSGVTTNQKLLVYPTAGDGDHIHMVTGNLYQTELFMGDDNFYMKLANTGDIVLHANTGLSDATWTFGANSSLILPGAGVTMDAATNALLTSGIANVTIGTFVQGADGGVSWEYQGDGANANTSYGAVGLDTGGTANTANLRFKVQLVADQGNASTNKEWLFDTSGNLTLPGNTFAVNYANGTQVSIGGSSYGNADVANYLPTFTGGNIGSPTGGQGVTNLNLSGNIVATPQLMSINWGTYHMDFSQYGRVEINSDLFANANTIGAQYLKGDGSNISNIAGANVSGLGNITTVNLTGSASNVLYGNGTFAAPVAEASFSIQTANFNANAGSRYGVNTSGGAVTATLPASPATGAAIFFADAGGAYASNNLTIARNGQTIMGASSDLTVSTNNQSVGLFYNGSTWRTYNAG